MPSGSRFGVKNEDVERPILRRLGPALADLPVVSRVPRLMTSPPTERPDDDHELAAHLAGAAGARLMELRRTDSGKGADHLRRAGDRVSHEFLLDALSRERPLDAVLSEEGADDGARLSAPRVWIVDPLDGTREFGEGRPDWAVHVALVVDGALAAGAVAMPATGKTFSTSDPGTLPPVRSGVLRLAVSRTRRPPEILALADRLGAELIEMGSAGAKTMAVVEGVADVYAHAGGQFEWDSAAPVAVARGFGLHTSRLDGTELRYNQPDPSLPDLLVCRPELADEVLRATRR